MKTILTCASCGEVETVDNTAEAKRSAHCGVCGGPLVERRQPGSVL